jgi:hypothetical protein
MTAHRSSPSSILVCNRFSGQRLRKWESPPDGNDNFPGYSIRCGNFRDPGHAHLQKSSCPFKRGHPERWPSGLRRTLGKRVCGKPYRGFESHSLRQHRKKPNKINMSLIIKGFLVARTGGTHGVCDLVCAPFEMPATEIFLGFLSTGLIAKRCRSSHLMAPFSVPPASGFNQTSFSRE